MSNIISSLVVATINILFSFLWGIKGAIIGTIFGIFTTFIVSLIFKNKVLKLVGIKITTKKINFSLIAELSRIAIASFFIGVFSLTVNLVNRSILIQNYGLNANGYLQSIVVFSSSYIALILGGISTYSFPNISKLFTNKQYSTIKQELGENFKLAILLIIPYILIQLGFSNTILTIFFSKEFQSANSLVPIYVLGDFFYISSWAFGVALVPIQKIKQWFIISFFSNLIILVVTVFGIKLFGIHTIPIGYALGWGFNFSTTIFTLRRNFINFKIFKEYWFIYAISILIFGYLNRLFIQSTFLNISISIILIIFAIIKIYDFFKINFISSLKKGIFHE